MASGKSIGQRVVAHWAVMTETRLLREQQEKACFQVSGATESTSSITPQENDTHLGHLVSITP